MIHPSLYWYAGGELLCFHVCKALQDLQYQVTLASDIFSPADAERIYGMGGVLERCQHKDIPRFSPILRSVLTFLQGPQRIVYSVRVKTLLSRINADVVFSTQSSPFFIPGRQQIHFVYGGVRELFGYPAPPRPLPIEGASPARRFVRTLYNWGLEQVKTRFLDRYPPNPTMFLATGSRIVNDLKQIGYLNSSLVFPPCRTVFRPSLPKRKQVIQLARVTPDKRLECFFEIAKRLPQYRFYLVGRNPQELRSKHPRYSEELLSKVPRNVSYIEGLTRERASLLEESKVYLYTGLEPGISVAFVEAIAAGCIVLSPRGVGSADVVGDSGVGYLYDSVDEAAVKVRHIMETDYASDHFTTISEKAQRFRPEIFEQRIKDLVNSPLARIDGVIVEKDASALICEQCIMSKHHHCDGSYAGSKTNGMGWSCCCGLYWSWLPDGKLY